MEPTILNKEELREIEYVLAREAWKHHTIMYDAKSMRERELETKYMSLMFKIRYMWQKERTEK